MERVAFLPDEAGQPIHCLLNPDSVVMKRLAGLDRRRTWGGLVTGTRLTDDPLLVTGGGRTEIELDLLFDVTLPGVVVASGDVRELTRPFWELAENAAHADDYGAPRRVRFVWGKTWNIPAVVAAIAERFERFTSTGVPERSWMRMRLLRTGEVADRTVAEPSEPAAAAGTQFEIPEVPDDQVAFHPIIGSEQQPAERLDEIATQYYGEPGLWRAIAQFNGISDPLNVPPPQVLRIPPIQAIRSIG
jgi:hypothetical protein